MKLIITERQYKKLLLKEVETEDYVPSNKIMPGTKKPLGSNGVDVNLVLKVLEISKLKLSGDTNIERVYNSVNSERKIKPSDKKIVKGYFSKIDEMCINDKNFNDDYKRLCFNLLETLHSDSDNVFSQSYGVV